MILGQATSFYIATLLIFIGVDFLAAWGFDLQYGTTRVINLSFIASQAAGAYTAAILTIGPPASGLGETYVFGAKLPFPVPWIAGAAAGALFSFVLGAIMAPRLRDEYFAIVTLVVGVGMLSFVSAYGPLFNGDQGLAGVPLPFSNSIIPTAGYLWLMVGITTGFVALCGLGIRLIHQAPLSRRLRAMRDNEGAAAAIGIAPMRVKLLVMTVGGALGGLSGVLLVNAFGAWGTGSWQLTELVAILTAVVVGGTGNPLGVALGVLLLIIGVGQAIQFTPGLNGGGVLGANLQAAVVAVVEVAFFWFRPRGVLPERVHRVKKPASTGGEVGVMDVSMLAVPQPRRSERESGPKPSTTPAELTAQTRVGSSSNGPVLEVDDLAVAFGGVTAVQHCSFALQAGITCLVGPNGAGKSTVVSAIAGTVRPRSGRILFDGGVLGGSPHDRVGKGLVRTFQLPQEFGTMTVLENVMVALPDRAGTTLGSAIFGTRRWRRQEIQSRDQAGDILSLCGLTSMANEQAETLSGGQKKLLELARALACRPKLLLLDEPTAGVAPHLYRQMTELLVRLRALKMSLLVISHEMSLVSAVADDVIVMADGRVLVQGPFEDVSQHGAVQDAYLGREPYVAGR